VCLNPEKNRKISSRTWQNRELNASSSLQKNHTVHILTEVTGMLHLHAGSVCDTGSVYLHPFAEGCVAAVILISYRAVAPG